MTEPDTTATPRDAPHWARGRNALRLAGVPAGAINLNVEGRRAVGPLQGFGQLWRRRYEIRLSGAAVTPAEVIRVWRAEFPRFWERDSRFYAPGTGIEAGDVVLINSPGPGGVRIATGILVLFADDESFTFMTPEGHPFSGWVTSSAHVEDGVTVARVEVLVRAADPLYEAAMPLGLSRDEDRTWRHTLEALAGRFGVPGRVESTAECLDPRRQWAHALNLRHNALLRSLLHTVTAPLRRRRQVTLSPAPGRPAAGADARVSGVVMRDQRAPANGGTRVPRDAANWATGTNALRVAGVPDGAINLNVEGRRVVGALQGFGQLWQKTYRVRLPGVAATPAEVVRMWKQRFPEFHPPASRFYPSLEGVAPGEILLINLSMRGMPVHTGVRVIYADEESFTVMTPEGHPESGWNTFSAYRGDDGTVVAQIQSLARTTDLIYEIGFRLVGATEQERTWNHVLTSLAAHFGVTEPVTTEKVCVDRRLQWSQLGNLWYNAGIRSVVYAAAAPLRWLRRAARRARFRPS